MDASVAMKNRINAKRKSQRISKNWSTCDYNQLPKWLQDNDYLHKRHRPALASYRQCFGSIFRVHTESGNIMTHLIGFLLFIVIAATFFTENEPKLIDNLMIGIYFCGALSCHLLSTVYHTCKCHSANASQLFHRLDYCGISMQIICSMIPAFYYGFHHKYIEWFYLYCSIGLILFAAALIISIKPQFGTPAYRPLRAAVFLTFGLSNIIPGLHWYMLAEQDFMYPLYLVVLQGLLYVVGAVIYALRVPEKYYAGKCDLWPQSHQIFHIFVTVAAVVHFTSIHRMIQLRQNVV